MAKQKTSKDKRAKSKRNAKENQSIVDAEDRLAARKKKKSRAAKNSATPTSTETKTEEIPRDQPGFPIVGIGASAGGLAALRRMLDAMPEDAGVACVVIQHLDPTKVSLTSELLDKTTSMHVKQVDDEPQVQPGHVYVIPP